MKTAQLLKKLDEQDQESQKWLFTVANLRVLFPNETENALKHSLQRHTQAGLLMQVSKGVYANPRGRSMPNDKLSALVPYLRPGVLNYVSQESRLSELGHISQIPLDYLSMMTTGKSNLFNTPFGRIQFTHTNRNLPTVLAHTQPDPSTGLLVADAYLSRLDLRRAGRNTHLLLLGNEVEHA